MNKTAVESFQPEVTTEDLKRLKIMPIERDVELTLSPPESHGPGRPKKGEEREEKVPVRGSVRRQTARLLEEIYSSKVIPGVVTMKDAVSAAVTLYVDLVYPRLRHGGLQDQWRAYRLLRTMYDQQIAYARTVGEVKTHAAGAALLYANEDLHGLDEYLRQLMSLINDIESWGVAKRFRSRLTQEFKELVPPETRDYILARWEREQDKPEWDHFNEALQHERELVLFETMEQREQE